MLAREDPEDLVGKRLTNRLDALKIKDDAAKPVEASHETLRL